MNNITPYKLKEDSWHCNFYKFIYNVNPIDKYNGFCPYFWTYVITFILLPIILLCKVFKIPVNIFTNLYGNIIDKYYNYKDVKYNETRKLKIELQAKNDSLLLNLYNQYVNDPSFTNAKAFYDLHCNIHGDMFFSVSHMINIIGDSERAAIYENISNIENMVAEYLTNIDTMKKERYNKITSNIYVRILFYAILIASAALLSYYVYTYFIVIITILIKVLMFAAGIGIVLLLCKYEDVIYKLLMNYIIYPILYIIRFIFIILGAKHIYNGIKFLCELIYIMYKNNCPRIIWIKKDEE